MADLSRLTEIARARLGDADPAHDFQHVLRVAENARQLAAAEGVDATVPVAAALLHELVNLPKNHPQSSQSGVLCAVEARRVLDAEGWDPTTAAHVADCIATHSFSSKMAPGSREAAIVQDADRLDAIGAIGIARCFATTAVMRRPFYDPDDPSCRHRPPDDKQWGIDHFYRKLLTIAPTLHTPAARHLAAQRQRFMESFLGQFMAEIGAGS